MRKLRHFVLIILKHDFNHSIDHYHIDFDWQGSPDKGQRPEIGRTRTRIKETYRSLPLLKSVSVSEINFTRI